MSDPLDAVPDSAQAAMTRAVRQLLVALPEALDMSALELAITAGDPIAAGQAFRPQELPYAPQTALVAAATAALRATGRATAREGLVVKSANVISLGHEMVGSVVKASLSATFRFDLENPAAGAWADRSAGRLIVEVTEGTRQTIRDLVASALRTGGHPYETARAIRPLIGLHTRWAQAVFNYRARLLDTGTTGDRVSSLTSRYYDRLLTTRSRTIARTETLQAANQGKFTAWDQAYRGGFLGTEVPTKTWIAAGDAEPICADLDGVEVSMYEDFDTEFGPVRMPPAHPNCRCTASVTGHGRNAA